MAGDEVGVQFRGNAEIDAGGDRDGELVPTRVGELVGVAHGEV